MKTALDWHDKFRVLENISPYVIREIQNEAFAEGEAKGYERGVHEAVEKCAEKVANKQYLINGTYYSRVTKESILRVESELKKGK